MTAVQEESESWTPKTNRACVYGWHVTSAQTLRFHR